MDTERVYKKKALTVKQPGRACHQKLGQESNRPDDPGVRRARMTALVCVTALSALVGVLTHDPDEPPSAQHAREATPAQIEDAATFSLAEAMLDEVNSLTPTEVLLDERASERWLPQIADLQRRAEDPGTSPAEREALVAVLRRLEDLGM